MAKKSDLRVYISPLFKREDKGDGGIRRVVEAQRKYLKHYGVKVVDSPDEADLIANHGTEMVERPGVPMVSHSHGMYWSRYAWPNWAYQANQQVTEALCRANAVTAPSDWVANAMRRGGLFYPEVIYHGVDAEQWQPGGNGGYVLWNKARADVVSDPADMNALAAKLKQVPFKSTFGEATSNVEILGPMPIGEMKRHIANAAVYLATARETFGIGTLEALACGVPVAGWDWGGQSEIILNGKTGYLAPYGDYDTLAECVLLCLKERETLSANARQDAIDRWNWPIRIRQYADLYQRVYAEHTRQRPKVSVIVTCYNLGRFLPDCLGSVLNQSLGDWECLIVDDGSTDETKAIALDWVARDGRFKYTPTPENLKLSRALNFGVSKAKGRYILPIDADNLLEKEGLKILSEALDTDSSIHIAYGHLDIVDEDLKNRRRGDWPFDSFSWRGQCAHLNQISSTAMVRREVYERSGGYRRRMWRAEDAEFWMRVTSRGFRARKVTQAAIFTYRNRADSKSKGEKGDGDWTAWMPWRLAGSWQEARQRARVLPEASPIPTAEFVPWAAQGKPPEAMRFWRVPDYALPLISIIIPVGKGHEPYLVDALDSLIAQDYDNWEVIVVNNTGYEWADGFESPVAGAPFARVVTCDRQHPGAARNLGASFARGRYLFWLDADDYLLPGALTKLVNVAKANPDAIVYGDWLRNDSDPTKEMLYFESWDFECGDVLRQMRHSITTLVPRSAHEAIGGFDESIIGWEDWDYFIALQAQGLCSIRIPEPVFVYRFRTGTRRETSFGSKPALLKYIRDKWKPYYEGKKKMACGGCPKPTYQPPPAPAGNEAEAGVNSVTVPAEAVLLEYNGTQPGPQVFLGDKTGTPYRFGLDQGHKRKYVHVSDAPGFLGRTTRGVPHFIKVESKVTQPAPPPAQEFSGTVLSSGRLRPEFPTLTVRVAEPETERAEPVEPVDSPSIKAMTYKQLRDVIAEKDEATLAGWLTEERRSETPRASVVKLITAALNALKEAA